MSAGLGEWVDADEGDLRPAEGGPGDNAQAPALYYGSVDEFVRNVVVEVYHRRVGPRSAQWWRSAEAIIRLEAMWRSWEHLRREPHTGMSVWLLSHGDPHMRVLMDPDGPFAGSEDVNGKNDALPYEPPPEGLFPDVRGRTGVH